MEFSSVHVSLRKLCLGEKELAHKVVFNSGFDLVTWPKWLNLVPRAFLGTRLQSDWHWLTEVTSNTSPWRQEQSRDHYEERRHISPNNKPILFKKLTLSVRTMDANAKHQERSRLSLHKVTRDRSLRLSCSAACMSFSVYSLINLLILFEIFLYITYSPHGARTGIPIAPSATPPVSASRWRAVELSRAFSLFTSFLARNTGELTAPAIVVTALAVMTAPVGNTSRPVNCFDQLDIKSEIFHKSWKQ